ncbi:Hypothetical protein AJAP_42885 (plasmid) [Amycolatopsis japonica]|uniref:Uncharacterized protein n=1 Tax=Amycolatopsis japonica TaxID=208439 RepID=A0A075V9Z6_9PSEU|nr:MULTISPECIES: hypothetical protein [Amycolatopsis]AIG81344.1 Hypothetical protein AJAP_42885 [Amycolatopsis japonica]RSN38531.1 hypothetical protein DMC64_41425 [Amycolatopsis sp. WAC 04197]
MLKPPAWEPADAEKTRRTPEIGDTIAYDRRAWIVKDVAAVPRDAWTETDRSMRETHGRDATPSLVTIHATTGTSSLRLRTWAGVVAWWIYPNGHYPVCGCCHEPVPCRAQEANQVSDVVFARALRFSEAGRCPECGGEVTANQRPIRFTENRVWPLGPAPIFHGHRKVCRAAAERYARESATTSSH